MDFAVKFEITPQDVARSLNEAVKPLKREVMQFLADEAPDAMQAVMMESSPAGNPARGGGKHSAYGQPPAIITRTLLTSLRGRVIDENTVEIEMAHYAQYLDPAFGGRLNRPFIQPGIIRALNNLPQSL